MNSPAEKFVRWAAAFGAAAVVVGAFGAHGLKNLFETRQLDAVRLLGIYEKGVQYHFYHALALGLVGLLARHSPGDTWLLWAGRLFTAGILMFSGSLYLLACRDVLPFSVSWAGSVTPLGGLCFIGGWLALLVSTLKKA